MDAELVLQAALLAKVVDKRDGTFGLVYILRREEPCYPRSFACKTIRPDKIARLQEDALRRFVHEAREWSKYSFHPLIASFRYVRMIEGRPFVVMPFYESNLRDYIDRRTDIDLVDALIFCLQICKGLLFTRTRGLTSHQDLKPENILLEDLSKRYRGFPPEGARECLKWRVKISDFGLANAWQQLGLFNGSKPYVSPEQWSKGGDLSRSDNFALGVIFSELLTGKHPIGKRTGDVWPTPAVGYPKRFMHDEFWKEWSSKSNKSVSFAEATPQLVRDLVIRCLDPRPERRPDLDGIYDVLMNALSELDKDSADGLKVLLDYYDGLASNWLGLIGSEERRHLEVQKMSEKAFAFVTEELRRDIDGLKIRTEYLDAYNLVTLFEKLLLLARLYCAKEGYEEKALGVVIELRQMLLHMHQRIEATQKYPYISDLRDIELIMEYVYGILQLLHLLNAQEVLDETRCLFEPDPVLHSALLYCDANSSRGTEKSYELLDRAYAINPDQTFLRFKEKWKEDDDLVKKARASHSGG